MYRGTLRMVLGLAVLALAGLGGPGTAGEEKGHKHGGPMMACARACADCTLECESCARHCAMLVLKGEKKHFHTMATCIDCGDICAVAGRVVARGGPMSATICDSCARACDDCGKACETSGPADEHMKRCAKACRVCAKACREMLKHTGHHDHDKTKVKGG
jgi:hypothetical protein